MVQSKLKIRNDNNNYDDNTQIILESSPMFAVKTSDDVGSVYSFADNEINRINGMSQTHIVK